jgi:flagellar biogenesis protein FliO
VNGLFVAVKVAAVFGLLALTLYYIRRHDSGRIRGARKTGRPVVVLGQARLSKASSVAVVEIAGDQYAVAVTDHRVQLLLERPVLIPSSEEVGPTVPAEKLKPQVRAEVESQVGVQATPAEIEAVLASRPSFGAALGEQFRLLKSRKAGLANARPATAAIAPEGPAFDEVLAEADDEVAAEISVPAAIEAAPVQAAPAQQIAVPPAATPRPVPIDNRKEVFAAAAAIVNATLAEVAPERPARPAAPSAQELTQEIPAQSSPAGPASSRPRRVQPKVRMAADRPAWADSIPAQSIPAQSTPAQSTPALSTPALSTPALNTPAPAAPIRAAAPAALADGRHDVFAAAAAIVSKTLAEHAPDLPTEPAVAFDSGDDVFATAASIVSKTLAEHAMNDAAIPAQDDRIAAAHSDVYDAAELSSTDLISGADGSALATRARTPGLQPG